MRLRFKPTHVVLAMLCIMYFITYIDRVNISTAASEIQKELQPQQHAARSGVLGLRLSLSPVSGGRRLGRRPLRAAQDLVLVRHDLGRLDHHDRLREQPADAVHRARRARLRRGRDLSDRDPRHAVLDPAVKRGFAQGLDPRLARLGNAITPP